MKQPKLRVALKKTGTTVAILLSVHWFLNAQVSSPSVRHLPHMIYDEQNKQILLYGGSTGGYTFNDLWALNASGWSKLSDGGPPERIKAAFTYDSNRKKAVLFGGSDANNKLLDDTWEWDGKAWKQSLATGPLTRNHAMSAYDKKIKLL